MTSFSTCWNSKRHATGDAGLREIKMKLGFDLIALDHGVRGRLRPGIQKLFAAGQGAFSSLVALPEYYKFSAGAVKERERAMKQAFQAIDLARQLNVPF